MEALIRDTPSPVQVSPPGRVAVKAAGRDIYLWAVREIKVVKELYPKWLAQCPRARDEAEQCPGRRYVVGQAARDVKAFVADNVAQVDFRKVDKVWLVDLLNT